MYCIRGYLNALQSAIENLNAGKGEAWLYMISNFKSWSIAGQSLRAARELRNMRMYVRVHARGRISQIRIPQCKCNDGRPATNARNIPENASEEVVLLFGLKVFSEEMCNLCLSRASIWKRPESIKSNFSSPNVFRICIFLRMFSRWIMFFFQTCVSPSQTSCKNNCSKWTFCSRETRTMQLCGLERNNYLNNFV